MHTLLRVGVTFLLAQSLSSAVAWACSCRSDTSSAEEKLASHDSVFVGTVRAQRSGCDTTPLSWSSADPVFVTLEVTQAFKGVTVGEEVELETATDGASCGVDFETGDSWLIYTSGTSYGLCSPGGKAEDVAGEIADLEAATE